LRYNTKNIELYAKVALYPLTALKMCSFTTGKLRFFGHFRLVMKHNPTFDFTSIEPSGRKKK